MTMLGITPTSRLNIWRNHQRHYLLHCKSATKVTVHGTRTRTNCMAFSWRFAATTSPATMDSGIAHTTSLLPQQPGRGGDDDDDHHHHLHLPAQAGLRRCQPPPLRFKGVVLQPNGRWGAQIYEGQERVWLGSFPDEPTAARAYDVAALRYRGLGAVTNFPSSRADKLRQLAFLAAHRRSEVVDMLRNQTYADELRQGVRRRHGGSPPAWARVPLFEKNVTASDVGKLNRLVVPKKDAVRHLPPVSEGENNNNVMILAVEDSEGKVWRFRYSYWKSSQSYVLTKGWIRFVREKGLRVGDTVVFSRWTFGPDEQLLIDCRKKLRKKKKTKKDVGTAGDIDVQAPVVRLFGVDIAVDVGGREAGEAAGPMASC